MKKKMVELSQNQNKKFKDFVNAFMGFCGFSLAKIYKINNKMQKLY